MEQNRGNTKKSTFLGASLGESIGQESFQAFKSTQLVFFYKSVILVQQVLRAPTIIHLMSLPIFQEHCFDIDDVEKEM